MKAITILAFIGLAVWGAMHFIKNAASYDPNAQGAAAKAAIAPGMTWKKVVVAAGEPKHYAVIDRKVQTIAGQQIETFKPAAKNPYSADVIAERILDVSLPHGFVFEYRFSQSVAFAVHFDDLGTVTLVQDLITMADLLQTK